MPALLMSATEILTVRTILTIRSISTTAVASASTMSESILPAVTLIVAILSGILLRLPAAAARYKCRKTADILSAFVTALVGLRVGPLLMLLMLLRAILDLLITRWKRLRITGQIRLLLRFARRVTWFVLAHKSLIVVVITIVAVVGADLRLAAGRAALLMRLLLVVVRVLLTKLLLRCGDQAKVVLGVLIIILSGHRVARTLRVTRELDVFFRDM
jgi:hypothetical protein